MLSESTKQRLVHALANQDMADELEKRISQELPSQSEAQEALDSYKDDEKLREHLVVALALKEAGDEISNRLDAAKKILEAIADGNEVAGSPAVSASFDGQVAGMNTDVQIEADNEGEDGNDIILSFDGSDDIDTVLAAWNIANPANTATLASGDGSQIPDNLEQIQLADGADEVLASDANTAPAVAAFGSQSLSESAMERLTVALASEEAASEFKQKFDEFVSAMND